MYVVLRNVLVVMLVILMPRHSSADQFVIANGSGLAIYETTDEGLVRGAQLLEPAEWAGVVWPNWNAAQGVVIFEGRPSGEEVGIFALELSRDGIPGEVRRVLDGRLPAVSPSGRYVATVDTQKRLRIVDMTHGSVLLEGGPEVHSSRPVVWVGDASVVFLGHDQELQFMDAASGEVRSVGVTGVLPAAAIADSRSVICIGYEGKKLAVVDVAVGSYREIRSYIGTSLGPSVIWDVSGKSFLVARQTWGNLFRLSDARDVFRLDLEGSEQWMADELTLFGGFRLK